MADKIRILINIDGGVFNGATVNDDAPPDIEILLIDSDLSEIGECPVDFQGVERKPIAEMAEEAKEVIRDYIRYLEIEHDAPFAYDGYDVEDVDVWAGIEEEE